MASKNRFRNMSILESLGDQNFDARYSVLGFEPQAVLRAKGDSLEIELGEGGDVIWSCDDKYPLSTSSTSPLKAYSPSLSKSI